MNAIITKSDVSNFLAQLNKICNRLDSSKGNPKAFALDLHRFTSLLDSSPCGAVINEDIKQKASLEEALFSEELAQLFALLDTTLDDICQYIKANTIDIADNIFTNQTHSYEAWKRYYSRETHDEALLKLCLILRDVIIVLVDIIENDERPHLTFARKFGTIRDDGTIESLQCFEALMQLSESPVLKKREQRLSGKWDPLVGLHHADDPEQFIKDNDPQVLCSHAHAIIDYAPIALALTKNSATIADPITDNTRATTTTPAQPKPSNGAVKVRDSVTFNHAQEELTILGYSIPCKNRGKIERTIIKFLFCKGKPKEKGVTMKKIHAKLNPRTCFDKKYIDSIDSGFRRLNKDVEKCTEENVKALIKRKGNKLFINPLHTCKNKVRTA